jgi:hypothetical protein
MSAASFHDPIAATSAAARAEVHAIYDDLDEAVRRLAPVCLASGRCCRFREFDHTLFLSGLEADLLCAEAPPEARPLDEGASCPWQDAAGLCTARDARPLGCRVYFCDPAYAGQAERLSEEYLGRLQRLSVRLARAWDYAPLHHHLRQAAADGRWGCAHRPAAPAGGF